MRFFTSLTVLFIAFLINALPGYGQEDLKISVSASHINADPGDEITYVIKYMNAGLTPASNVIITSQLPDIGKYTYVSSNPQGTVSGNIITWDHSQIPELTSLSNGECQITVTVKAGIPGNGITQFSSGYYISSSTAILNYSATIKSNSTFTPVQSNMVSTTIVQSYNVHINNASGVIKSATGTTIYYMIQVTNNGNVYDRYNLSSLNYDCDGPGELDYDKLTAEFTDMNGNAITKTDWIEPDQTFFFLLKLTAPTGTNPGKWSCHDVIATSAASGSTGVGKIQTQTEGAPHYPLVSLSKIDDKDPIEAGELLNYTIYAFNSNDSYAANNFVIKETYPPNITFISSTPAPDPGFNNQWSMGNLEYGLAGAKTINITLRVNSLSNCNGNITNTVAASYEGYDSSNPPRATVVTSIKSYPDLVITKTAQSSSIPAKKGTSITYTVNYQNIGTCDAPNSQIMDLFDDVHTNIISAGGGTQSGNEISWNLGTLTPGQSGTITYTALIDPGSTFNPGTTTLKNKVTISTSEIESNYNNNTANASILVSVLPDMKVEVLSENIVIEQGKENTYTLKISNIGDIKASNVEIKNLLPTGLLIGFISDGGVNMDGTVTWPVISTFEVGSSVEYQVKVTPSCSFMPSITSIATVTSSIIDKDDTNNSATVNSIVQDVTLPVLANVPSDFSTSCETIPAVGTPTATDNCDNTPVVHYLGEVSTRGTDPLMPDYYNYTLTRSWDATDASGNHSNTGIQVITVKDVTPPVMPILQDVTVGECSGTPIIPTTTDICKGTVIGTTTTIFPITAQSTTIVEWTFDDGNGNVTKANQKVIVDDTTPPVADMAVLAPLTGQYTVTAIAPTATDNCKGSITGTTTDPLTYSEQGTYIIHWVYDDGNGNTSTQTQTVVVDDTIAPDTPVLSDVIVGECSGTPQAPTTTDNTSGIITGTTSTTFPITQQGATVVTWSFDDGYGNVTTSVQNVIVDDITGPEKPQLADVTVGECSGTPTAPTTTDNCAGIITGTTTTLFPITKQGVTIVEWTFDDGNGNITTASQNVIVDDITPPVAPVLADVTVGECSGTPPPPTTTDNCAGIITGTTTTLFPITKQGVTIVEWTFDDGNGNITTASQNIIVEDITPPVAPVLADVTVGECSGTPTAPTTTDNCAGIITGTTTTSFPITKQGVTVVEWTFDDGNGNNTKVSQNVIVEDITPPVASVLADVTVGECSGTPQTPTTTDNCAGIISGTTNTPFPITKQGVTVVEWTFDDGNGNKTKVSQNVIVEDITPHVAPVLADVTVGECSGTPQTPTTTDNCAGIITGTTTTSFPITKQGVTVVEWTFDDGKGNKTQVSQNVIVEDITPPEAPVLADVTVGECSGTPSAPTTTDNCAGTITGTTTTSFPITKQGVTVVEWTFDDGNGNKTKVSQNVVVKDVTSPVAPILTDITVGECNGTPQTPSTTDNCSGTITGTANTPFPITTQGITIVTWTFDDGNGNVTTVSQKVIVTDVTPPTTIVLAEVTVGECSGTPIVPSITDNCTGTITGTTTTPFPITTQGTTVVEWTFYDGNGNTTTAIQNVIVHDGTPPVKPILADVTVGECSGTPIAPTTTDNCSGIITGTTTTSFPITKQGLTIVEWTFDDGNGNTTTASQNVIMDDVSAPVKPILADVTVGECSGTPVAPITTDNCSGTITGTTTTQFPITKQGTTIVEWTFDDGNGNTTTASQNVIVDDITAPVALVLADVTVGECSGTPVAPITTDNCSGTITGTTATQFPITKQGTTIVEWTFDDGNGNITTVSQNVIVHDVTPPVIPVLADVTVGECSGTPVAPITADNCSGTITGTTTTQFPITTQGTIVVEWTFDDGNGNTTTAIQNVIVHDGTAPVKPILADVTVGECSGTPVAPTTNDNCSGTITGTTATQFPITKQGTTIVEWTFDDGNGNTTTASQNVIVDDVSAPIKPILADVTVGECSGTPVAPTIMDNCSGIITGTTFTPFPITNQGLTVVEWTFDDGHGNISTVSQNVIVDDVTPPVIPVLADVIVGECSGTPLAPTTTDNCSGTITGTTTTTFPIITQGTTIVEWNFDDGNGNKTTAHQNVIVKDITSPVMPVLADVTVGECSGTPVAPTTTDNCAGIITGTTTTPFPITMQGVTVVEWTFDDGNGNTITVSQNVIVDDVTPPDKPILADVTVGECSGTPVAPTTTDNCSGTITGTTTTQFPITKQGTTIVEWTFDDGNGNITTVSQKVIIDDVTPPVTPILADVTVGECSGIPVAPTTTDNCVGIITGTTSTQFPIITQGTTVVEWTFNDGHGNISTVSQNVIVDDVTPPVTPVLADVTVGECSGTLQAPTTTDNCSGTIIGSTSTTFPITTQGVNVVEWTFNDGHGNISTVSQNVIVDDVTAPLTPVLADVTVGECSGTPVAPTTTDNCTGTITGTTTTQFPITKQGTTIVEWTFDDGNGNITKAFQNVIVDDVTPPVTPILADVTVGECSGTPTAPTTIDNCAGIITGTTTTPFPIIKQGTTVVEWTFDDGNGNITTVPQNVIVKDVTPPQIAGTIAGTTIEGCNPEDATLAVTTIAQLEALGLSITDACFPDNNLTIIHSDTFSGTAPVIVTRTYTISDPAGNAATTIQTITVADSQDPLITNATPSESYQANNGKCTYTVMSYDLDPIATSDNCSVKSITNDFTNTSSLKDAVFPLGKTLVKWTVEDMSGNTSSSTYEVVVVDTQNPNISCATPSTNYPSDPGMCSYTVRGTDMDPIAIADNCSVKSVINDFTNTASLKGAVFPLGTTLVKWTVEDNNGNVASCSYHVVVVDKQNPVIICATAEAGYSYNTFGTELDPIVSDNCSVSSITNDFNNSASIANAVFPVGSTIVTWKATDESGNSAMCSYTIVITDTQPPVISCASVSADGYATDIESNVYKVPGTELDPTADDNYSEVSLINNYNNTATLTNAQFPVGQTTVVWTATDKSGNTASCTQIVWVKDLQEPTIICPSNININADAGQCAAFGLTLGVPVTADNCSVASVSNDAPSTFPAGTTVVTWKVTDASGNMATCTQTVTVNGTPKAVDDNVTVKEDNELTGNVMANDEGCKMAVVVQSNSEPIHGSLTIAGNGSYSYIPDDNYYGNDSFTYRSCSGNGDCSEATVNITVESVDDLPQATNDDQKIELDLALEGNVASNDLLSGDGANVWSLVDSPSHGTIDFHQDGSYSYTAATDFLGSDSFTYQLCDQDGDCSRARVTITIEDVLSPNQILTPNGDLINDTFIIEGIELYPANKVTIYNRWGNIVYRKNNYQNEWDGAANGNKIGSQDLPVGTYYYLIDYGKNRHKTGFVYLDR